MDALDGASVRSASECRWRSQAHEARAAPLTP